MKFLLSFIFSCIIYFSSFAQLNVTVTINSGTSESTCTDGVFGGGPELHWQVDVENRGPVTYPQAGNCFTDPPNIQFAETLTCSTSSPEILVCFTAFEDDGALCFISADCAEQICQSFPLPTPDSPANHTLSIPNDGINASWGHVDFTITTSGSPLGNGNNFICDAIDLGMLNSGGNLGNSSLSSYSNFCANNFSEPSPWQGNNDQGVWFQFTTASEPGTIIEFEAKSDPQNFGSRIDLQLAIYESSNGNCDGNLTLVYDEYDGLGFSYDETMEAGCLKPNTTYFLLVDGERGLISGVGDEGYFGLQLSDNGIIHPHPQAPDLICDALPLGAVPNGGTVSTLPLSQSNFCGGNTGEVNPSNWTNNKGVWYNFIAPSSGHVNIAATTDQAPPIGVDAIDLELAVYGSSNGMCTGVLIEENSGYDPSTFDEDLEVSCLIPGVTYWVLVDGSFTDQSGIFDISVTDAIVPTLENTGIDIHVACDSLEWMDGNTYYESNNSATHILTNITGCDSVITLDLTILYSSLRTDTVTECQTFTWVDGITYTNSTNTPTIIIEGGAANGCDSIVTLNLTIFNPSLVVKDIAYVDAGVSGGLVSGSSWTNALTDLQFAIDLTSSCPNVSEVHVASGTYFPTKSPDESGSSAQDRKNAFHVDSDMIIKGSYNSSTDVRDYNNPSILSGDFNVDDVITGNGPNLNISNNSENAHHVLITANLSNASLLDGFLIQGGNADGVDPLQYSNESISSSSGGGMVNFSSSPIVTNTALIGNSSSISGGGMCNYNSSPLQTNSVFALNASGLGGAIFNHGSSPMTTSTTFYGNQATIDGGIHNALNSLPSLNNSVMYNNGTDIGNASGGAITGANNFSENFLQAGFTALTASPFLEALDPDGIDDILGTEDDGLVPAADSPLREAGDNSLNFLAVDIAGQQRIRENTIDVGAYEGRCALTLTLGMDDSPLSGVIYAEQSIFIDGAVQVMPGEVLELNAPVVKLSSMMDISSEAVFTVAMGGCN